MDIPANPWQQRKREIFCGDSWMAKHIHRDPCMKIPRIQWKRTKSIPWVSMVSDRNPKDSRRRTHVDLINIHFAGRSIDIHGQPWFCTDNQGHPLIFMKHWHPWISWISMDNQWHPWTTMHGWLLIPIAWRATEIHGNPLIPMKVHGHPWTWIHGIHG